MQLYPYFTNAIFHNTKLRLNSSLIPYYQNNILLERRADNFQWGLIGGAIEVGESPPFSASRELFEETGITGDFRLFKLQGVYGDLQDHRVAHYPEHTLHLVDIVYTYQLHSLLPLRISDESIELNFFSHSDLDQLDLIRPALRPIKDFFNTFQSSSNPSLDQH